MLGLGIALDKLWPNNVADRISDEDRGSHDGFLSGSRNIACADCDDETDDWPEETSERVANDWNSRMVSPVRFPDHHTSSNDR